MLAVVIPLAPFLRGNSLCRSSVPSNSPLKRAGLLSSKKVVYCRQIKYGK